jgi:hypothetical protein
VSCGAGAYLVDASVMSCVFLACLKKRLVPPFSALTRNSIFPSSGMDAIVKGWFWRGTIE